MRPRPGGGVAFAGPFFRWPCLCRRRAFWQANSPYTATICPNPNGALCWPAAQLLGDRRREPPLGVFSGCHRAACRRCRAGCALSTPSRPMLSPLRRPMLHPQPARSKDAPVRRKDAAEPRGGAIGGAAPRPSSKSVSRCPGSFLGAGDERAQATAQPPAHRPGRPIALSRRIEAGQSHIAVGDRVQVTRASALFGRRYRIPALARGAVNATRLRCERLELGSDTRRKCAVLDRRSGQQAAAPSGG